MERSRVEDIKKKFECLQNQSTTNKYVNKTHTAFKGKSGFVGQPSSRNELQTVRLSNTNTTNFVGRGNIKRSHAFRADKPISRNFCTLGNDAPQTLSDSHDNELSVQRSPDNIGATNNELKSKKILNDSRQMKYSISSRKKENVDSDKNKSSSSNSVIGISEIRNIDSSSNADKRNRSLESVKKPVDMYSTVFKSQKTPDLLLSRVCDNLDISEKSANVNNVTQSEVLPIKTYEKKVEINTNERQKSRNASPKISIANDDQLTNTLKAALSAPLPSGPPPKKPPRTFAHNMSNNLNDPVDDKECKKKAVLKTNSASAVKQNGNDFMLNRPIRSKTESQIMLKKLENYLMNHQQNVLEASSKVNVCKSLTRHKTRHGNESNTAAETLQRSPFREDNETSTKINNARFLANAVSNIDNENSCFHSLNCTRQPVYDNPIRKRSNFFITIPRHSSVDNGKLDHNGRRSNEFPKPSYGLIKRSASEEHIYAEPETLMNEMNNRFLNSSNPESKKALKFKCATISDRGSLRPSLALSAFSSSSSPNDVSKRGDVQSLRRNFERASCSKDSVDQAMITHSGLHYMCTPINDAATGFNDSVDLASNASDGINSKQVNHMGSSLSERSKVVNEAVNTNVRVNTSPLQLYSMSKSNSTSDQLSQLSLVSDCSRPRQIRMTSTADQSADIDKHRIHQILSEAYGKIKHSNSDRLLAAVATGSSGDLASGSDSDCSSVISSPDDPLHSTFLSQPLGVAADSVVPSIIANSAGGILVKTSRDREQITAERVGYVRRVSRRMTSVRRSPHLTPDRFSHLFECLLLVGLDLNSARCKVPYIKTKFPEDAASPAGIESLCFPDADDWPPSPDSGQSYIQILTDSNGVRKYSYCRRVQPEDAAICLPLVYCIITPFKSNAFYNKILIDLESRHGHQTDTELLNFIEQLYCCPFPAPGQTLSFQQQINSENMVDVYKRPLDSRKEDNELIQLLTTVKLSIFLQIFATLLHERKVILVSDSISKLSVCIEGLQSALYPFHWQHTIVPILPSVIMDVCEAPTPYLIGIIKPKLSDIPFNNVDLDLVIDIDDGLILNSKGDEGWILPSRLSRGLRSTLQLSVQNSQSDMNSANVLANEAIMRLFVELVGNYRDHISFVSTDVKKREFQRESFIRSCPSRNVQLFLEWFTETAMFNAFVESRLERTTESRGLFEQRCSEYNEDNENGHSIMKNYKSLNKTVKTLGDRFKAAIS